jgi:hypothetical protein
MRRVLGTGLLLAAIGVSAAEPAQKPIHFRAHARVSLDAQGVPQKVDVDQKLPNLVRTVIEERVMQWRFEPAMVGDRPHAGATTVFVDACAAPAAEGMRLAVDYNWNGPGYADGRYFPPAPRYPIDAAKQGKVGEFRVVMRIGADGRASVDEIQTQKGELRRFEQALNSWVASLRYVPEEIDGTPVTTRVAVPVSFSMGGSLSHRQQAREEREARQRSPECTAAMGGDSESDETSRPVVLDSPFKPITTG